MEKVRYLLKFALFGAFFAFIGLVGGWQWHRLFEGKEMYIGTHPVTWSWVWNFLYASSIPGAALALIIGGIKLLFVRGQEKNAKLLRLEKTVYELEGKLEEFTKPPPPPMLAPLPEPTPEPEDDDDASIGALEKDDEEYVFIDAPEKKIIGPEEYLNKFKEEPRDDNLPDNDDLETTSGEIEDDEPVEEVDTDPGSTPPPLPPPDGKPTES